MTTNSSSQLETPVVDAHVHALPKALLEAVAATADGIDGVRAAPVDGGWHVTLPGAAEPKLVRPLMVNSAKRGGWAHDQGITAQVVSPWLDAQPTAAMPPAQARDWAQRLNAALVEQERADGGANLVLATVAVHSGEQAAKDLERAVTSDGLSGLILSTNPEGLSSLADPELEPLWAAAAGLQAPVVLHPPANGPARALPDSGEFGNTYCRLVDTTFAVSKLLLSGVLDRNPALRLVVVHGGGFLAYQSMRLNGGHRADGLAHYDIQRAQPSDYLGDLYFDTVAMSPAAIRFLVDSVGAAQVLLGSDYPFPIGDPTPVATVRSARLGDDDTAAVLGGTASHIFDITANSRSVHV
jgi:aminocarboxymuconate-semialdehyde decarboxylase